MNKTEERRPLTLTPEQVEALAAFEAEKREHEAFLAENVKLVDRTMGQLLSGIDALVSRLEQRELQTAHNKEK